ncbi:MAG: hypothetical protein VX877_00880, partial [Planctomycetota bacterium]|nr:hypothetical protein [Planctomycetota bacterium]
MSLFDQVNTLQREWTDKYVQVDGTVAELRRFAGLTGQVKTVNMSGQALVEFDGSEDIGWYDIHPNFLTIVEAKQEVETAAPESAPEAAAAETAAPAAAAEAPAPAAAVDTSKLSPLELARMQDAGGDAPTPAAAAPAAEEATPAPAAEAPAPAAPAV